MANKIEFGKEMPPSYEAKSLDAEPTHILITHKSQDACMLFRASDGILCCMQEKAVVVFGTSPKDKDSRTFLDKGYAEKWCRGYAETDLTSQGLSGEPVIEERNGEAHGLYVPDGSLELPGFGGGRGRAN